MPPPKPPKHPHPPPHAHHVSSSAIAAFIEPERVEALLAPLVPEKEDRAFVVRCLLGEGPAHHRGANYVLLALMGQVLEKLGGAAGGGSESLPVPMRLPPHLARDGEERHYPLGLAVAPLERLAPRESARFSALVDCLTDGPPQHALANAAMVALLGQVLARLEAGTK